MTTPPSGPKEFEPEWLQRSLDRYLMWGLAFMLVLIVAFPIYRLRESTLRSDAKVAQQANYVKGGSALFQQNCSTCHGPQGTGGSTAPTLHSKEFLSGTADNQIQLLISTGVPGSSMSPWSQDFDGPLTSEQIKELVVYLRSLEKDAPSIPDWRSGKKAAG
jgi:mono/diheme cytochrome c family protein